MKKIKIPRSLTVGLISVAIGLVFGAVIMLLIGKNPISAYQYLIIGATKNISKIGNILAIGTPLILTGLAVAFAFRTGLFNIGVPGQMFIGGLVSVIIALYVDIPFWGTQILAIIGGTLAGALWALVPAVLKSKFSVNEVVITIMTNWIAYWVVKYAVASEFLHGVFLTDSKTVAPEHTLRINALTKLFGGTYVNFGLLLAVVGVFVVWFLIEKTTLGFELKAVGFNRHASKYAGIKVSRDFIVSMMISGALAGLAGVTYYIGYSTSISSGALPSQGYDGIAIALLGANNPFGVAIAALFFAFLYAGVGFMSAMAQIPQELSSVIIAVIIYFAATSGLIERVMKNAETARQERIEKKMRAKEVK